jgi:hypothetical protein
MQMMDHLGYAEAQKILGYRLSGGESLTRDAKATAEKKVVELHGAIAKAVAEVAMKPSHPVVNGVLLFNFRIGDVNPQHDANLSILAQVRQVAAAQGYVTIAIPQMDSTTYEKDFNNKLDTNIPSNTPEKSKPFMGSYTFDLLDVVRKDSGTRAPFMDNTAKAYFWHLTASFLQGKFSPLGAADASKLPDNLKAAKIQDVPQQHPIVGLMGGRSGSTDLPAFVGLRVYSWEEPMLAALSPTQDKPAKSGDWNASYYRIQGPQALRLFNQFPVTITGSLDLSGFRVASGVRTYAALDISDGRLAEWLKGGPQKEQGPIPLPQQTSAFLAVSDGALGTPPKSRCKSWSRA